MAATLSARPRSERGKNAARALRREQRVPAVIYGHGEQTQALSLDALELQRLLVHINADTTIIDLSIEGRAPVRALMREMQTHPIRPGIVHVDFLLIHADELLTVEVPVRLLGTATGVANDGGVLEQVIYGLEVECLPADIPEVIEIDISHLGIGDAVRVREVSVEKVTILQDEDQTIAAVVLPSVAPTDEELEAAEEAEPEVIGGRKDEDEDEE